MAGIAEVALWMQSEIEFEKTLYQQEAAYKIAERFGDDFIYLNDRGNLAISKAVLDHFRRLTEENVVWIRGERCWRIREDFDDPSRGQT